MNVQETLFAGSLRGEVLKIVYERPDGEYTVLRLLDDAKKEHTVVGPVSGIGPGQHVELLGRWEKHPEFGRQFRAESFRPVLPSSADGITRFLGSGAIPGIGPKTAKLIVDHFGEETLKVLDKYPRRLREVPGIGKVKAESVIEAWQESGSRRDIFIYLQGLGISQTYCTRLFKRYGDETAEVVRNNPYRLAEEIDGIGFLRADEIAAEIGIARNSPERMTAAAVYAMNQITQKGHTGCPEAEFLGVIAELTGQPEELAVIGIDRAVARRLLFREDGLVFAPQLARAEKELPLLVQHLAENESFAGARCRPVAAASQLRLSAEQRQAVDRLREAPLCIITGGPGVGKTTVVGEIVHRAQAAGLRIAVAAPTGRAAKRLTESTGLQAKTLHRLLGYDPHTGQFAYDYDHKLPFDLIIVDEVSMLDILLALALFRAIHTGSSVVLVGDRDQLPSVGPGTVLASFIASGYFLVTNLEHVFRQAENSRIIINAHRVNRGLLPEKPATRDDELADFYWVEQDEPERVIQIILKMVGERIPARFGMDPFRDIQVLSPMNRGSCGTQAINLALQQALNGGDKPQFKLGDRVFKAGDKVMQSSNDYDKLVFNGDLGRIGRIDSKTKKFQVIFDGTRAVDYDLEDAGALAMAYAITVHKSQGSEFPAVVIPMLTQHYMMLQRNLLYTAMTRARRLLLLIGSRKAIEMAVRNTRIEPRYTQLTERLQALKNN